MTQRRFSRGFAAGSTGPSGGEFLVAVAVSFVVHALLAGLAWQGLLFPRFDRPARQVYQVEILTTLPGSPSRVVAVAPPTPVAVPTARPAAVPSPAALPKNSASVSRKATTTNVSKTSSAAVDAEKSALAESLARLQEKRAFDRKMEQLKQRTAQQSSATAAKAEAEKAEKLTKYEIWYKTRGQATWRYLFQNYDNNTNKLEKLQVTALVRFDSQGNLLDFEIKPSGDNNFDKSVQRAIEQIRYLNTPPNEVVELTVIFNLKELLQ